jgi:hypothetical protein
MEEPTRDWIGQIFVERLEHQYRLRQAEKLLAVFEGAHGQRAVWKSLRHGLPRPKAGQ